MENMRIVKGLPLIGWREWVSLPKLNIQKIQAKIDSGAKTSALHAFNIHYETDNGKKFVKFNVYTIPKRTDSIQTIKTLLIYKTRVRSSNGQWELRPVIRTSVKLGDYIFSIKLTLTKRDKMKFRLLLGREALRDRFVVDTGQSYLHKEK